MDKEEEGSTERRCPAASLTGDLFIDILSRLPARSVCRSKCVSRTWRDIISHPDHRRKLPQTLGGFFYRRSGNDVPDLRFTSSSGSDRRPLIAASFDFLPNQRISFLDCCNGLLLCRLRDVQDDFHYVVYNPSTEQWLALPESGHASGMGYARLGFDPDDSPNFHVFKFLELEDQVLPVYAAGVQVYSSSTGAWVHKENGWNGRIRLVEPWSSTVFFKGSLHLLTTEITSLTYISPEHTVAVMDTEGKTQRNIAVPEGPRDARGSIHLSQGCLHYANFERHNAGVVRLVVYVLENYDSQEWTLKHSTEASHVFGGRSVRLVDFEWVAMHPECNLIFFETAGPARALVCYDMDRQQVQVICDGDEPILPYLPYVPLYSELEALHM